MFRNEKKYAKTQTCVFTDKNTKKIIKWKKRVLLDYLQKQHFHIIKLYDNTISQF